MTGARGIPRLAGFGNSRDLGGWPTAAGGRTRFDSVIRSNTPAALSDTDLRAASAVGLASVIDLRTAAELAVAPHRLAAVAGYRHRPLVDERAESTRDPSRECALGDVYAASLSRNRVTIAAVMAAVAAAPPGPMMICCAAGRDRTGMVAALLLDLADATHDAIECDYALSGASVDAAMLQVAAQPIRQMLDHLDAQFGGSRTYLTWLGLGVSEVDALIRRLA